MSADSSEYSAKPVERRRLPPASPSSGQTWTRYEYTFSAADPDGNDLYYYIEWGDGTAEEWIGPYSSEEEAIADHMWKIRGTRSVRAKAKDVYGEESDWGTLEVTMPVTINSFFIRLLEYFPNAFPLLRYITGL